MNFSLLCLFAVLLLTMMEVSAQPAHHDSAMSMLDLQELVDSKYKATVNNSPWMGISVGVLTPDHGMSFFNYGRQNSSGPLVTADTIFAVNSMTKVFTSVALAYMNNQQRVHLNDSIQSYTDHVMPVDIDKSEMSFLDLATHWSGLTRSPTNLFMDQDDPYQGYTDDMFFADLKTYNFSAQNLHIDKQYLYSNYAYGLLAYILSNEILESNFKNMMETLIFRPLSMDGSALTTDTPKPVTFANGHATDGSQRPWGSSCETVLGMCILSYNV